MAPGNGIMGHLVRGYLITGFIHSSNSTVQADPKQYLCKEE